MKCRNRLASSLFLSLLATAALAAESQGLPAEVVRVIKQPLDQRLEAVGTLLANEAVTVRPERTGRISAIHFEEGLPVAGGEKLFTLESSTEIAAMRQVEASRDLSRIELDQAEQLLQRKLGSRHDRDKAQAQLNIDQARVNLARTALDKMTLYAPFSGYAGIRQVSVGDYVSTGQNLVDLVDRGRLKLDFHLPERHLARLRTGQAVEVTTEALPGETFQGAIYAIAPQVDQSSRSIELRALIDNSDQRLLPGLFARVSLLIERRDDALLVPEEAIIPRGTEFFVYRVNAGQVENVGVTLGQRSNGNVEILSGLQVGDLVVTAGQLKLRPGGPVTALFADGTPAEETR